MQRGPRLFLAFLFGQLCLSAAAQEGASPADLAREIEALRAEDPEARQNAIRALSRVRDPSAAVPALVEMLKDPDAQVRLAAIEFFDRIGTVGGGSYLEPSVPALVEILQAPDVELRMGAAVALAWRDEPEPEAIVPVLVEAFQQKNGAIQHLAANALEQLGPRAKAAVPALIEAVEAPESEVHATAIETIGRIGPEASAAVPALIQVLQSRPPAAGTGRDPRLRGGNDLAPSPGPGAVGIPGTQITQDPHAQRGNAATALGRNGPEARVAIPALVEALKAENAILRRESAAALGKLGPEGQAALQAAGYAGP